LWEVLEREDVSDGVGIVVAMCGDEVGERAMRKRIGGGVGWELLDDRMARQWEEECEVMTWGVSRNTGY
jgi:hypothetical protein